MNIEKKNYEWLLLLHERAEAFEKYEALDWCKQRSQAVAEEARMKKKKQRKKAIYGIWFWDMRRVKYKTNWQRKMRGGWFIYSKSKESYYIYFIMI